MGDLSSQSSRIGAERALRVDRPPPALSLSFSPATQGGALYPEALSNNAFKFQVYPISPLALGCVGRAPPATPRRFLRSLSITRSWSVQLLASSLVISAGQDHQLIAIEPINQAMNLIDAA
jgi:hypothetical protein